MTPERWKQINALFSAVLDRDPAERKSFLADACAGDSALREEVQRLLEHDEQAGRGFLARAPSNVKVGLLDVEADPLVGRTIGPYAIESLIARGGMGAVYGAVHTKLDKIVAVKVLPPERMSDPELRARFEREIKAVGGLQHPNIVGAHDAGESDGIHYLVMEHVNGVDLSTLVRQRGTLSVRDACEIARQTAVGLQYAHENGLIHRDVKPSNLMLAVSSTGRVVKILDLGLARLQDRQNVASDSTKTG